MAFQNVFSEKGHTCNWPAKRIVHDIYMTNMNTWPVEYHLQLISGHDSDKQAH